MTFWEGLAAFFSKLFQPQNPVPEPPAPSPTPTWVPPVPPTSDYVIAVLLELHNSARRSVSEKVLTISEPLNRAAQHHAEWMAKNRSMDHSESPGTIGFDAQSFAQRLKNESYSLTAGAENIAAGQATPEAVFADWMSDGPHRANILGSVYWNVGFGHAVDIFGHIYWCTVFATPMSRGILRSVKLVRAQITVSLPRAIVKG